MSKSKYSSSFPTDIVHIFIGLCANTKPIHTTHFCLPPSSKKGVSNHRTKRAYLTSGEVVQSSFFTVNPLPQPVSWQSYKSGYLSGWLGEEGGKGGGGWVEVAGKDMGGGVKAKYSLIGGVLLGSCYSFGATGSAPVGKS